MQESNPQVPVAPVEIKKSFPVLTLVLVIVLILSLAGSGYLAYQNMQLTKQIVEMKVAVSPSPSPVDTVNNIYYSKMFNYSVEIPTNWTADDKNIFIGLPGEVAFYPSSEKNPREPIDPTNVNISIEVIDGQTQQSRYSLTSEGDYQSWL